LLGQPGPSLYLPYFSISEVKTDESVTILTNNMPANKNFNVLMGEIGTKGINGIVRRYT
jgi:hypothetical protein